MTDAEKQRVEALMDEIARILPGHGIALAILLPTDGGGWQGCSVLDNGIDAGDQEFIGQCFDERAVALAAIERRVN